MKTNWYFKHEALKTEPKPQPSVSKMPVVYLEVGNGIASIGNPNDKKLNLIIVFVY